MNRHRSYSLLELVVVIANFATLFAVLLPAIHKARVSEMRIRDSNDVKQIGLAMHQ